MTSPTHLEFQSINKAQQRYCEQWTKSVREIEAQHIYEWASKNALNFIGPKQSIIEIGCGIGASALRIVKTLAPSKLIAIKAMF